MISSIPGLGGLEIVELSRLMLHESHDAGRLARLRERMTSEGVQSNPVIASPHEDNFLVLDGAHRVHALRSLGCELALIQRVDLPEESESWQHLLEGALPPDRVEGVEVYGDSDDGVVAEIEVGGGGRFSARARDRGDLSSEVSLLWNLQALYAEGAVVTRVEPDEAVSLSGGETLIRYRSFSTPELVEIVSRNAVLPAGITRFRTPRRVLGVGFSLDFLRGNAASATASANLELKSLVEKRSRENRIRRYDEPIILFE